MIAYGLKAQGLFDNLKIAQEGPHYMDHQGKYPVIFVKFKNVKQTHYTDVYDSLVGLISTVYREHSYLLSSPVLRDDEKNYLKIF